jgi:amino acid permease
MRRYDAKDAPLEGGAVARVRDHAPPCVSRAYTCCAFTSALPSATQTEFARSFLRVLAGQHNEANDDERADHRSPNRTQRGRTMIILGVVLILIGILVGAPILYSIGVILAIVGAVLWILGAAGREVGGRRHYY